MISTENKTLVILTPGFPEDEADSTCLPFLQNLVIELNEQFPLLNIVILAFDYPFITGEYKWHNNTVTSFNGWKKRKFKKALKWLYIWGRLKKIKKDNNTTGLLSLWCSECAYLGKQFAKRNRLPHFCWIQGQDAKKENKYVSRIKPGPEELVALSDFIQQEFEKNHGIRPQHIIPVGIRAAEFAKEDLARNIDILGAGSLIPLKQYGLFVQTIHYIKQFLPGVKAVLCGKGPEEKNIRALIAKLQLQQNIVLTGELPHEEILRYMKRSKVFLHTSNYEGLGVVCIEALYAGCHVISFVKPLNDNIAQWHIVETKEEMVEKVHAILNNPGTAYKSVLTVTMKESAEKLMQLYNYNEPASR